jgi:hypothetical protein
MSQILQPTGTLSASELKSDTLYFTDGSTRIAHTEGNMFINAPALVAATAVEVKLPSATFTSAGGTFDQTLAVTGVTAMTAVDTPVVTATNTVSTNVINAVAPGSDDLVVDANKVVLNADVLVGGQIDVVDTESMLVRDKILTMGAIDADGDGTADASDMTRDGAGIAVPGPPANLPADKDAADYEHAVKWRVHGGDFTGGGVPTAPHLKPMWEFSGGALAIACPDASDRIARFVFSPSFTSTAASLGLYYAVGSNAYLVQTFSTTPLS